MSFTATIALALLDWHCSTSRTPTPMKSRIQPHGYLTLRGGSKIDRLPNEILSTIFLLAIEQPQHCHDDLDPSLTTSPTTLSHICRRWRQVSLGTGSLWTHIVLTYPTSNEQLTRALTWLSRSKSYPLDILLDFRDPYWDWEEETHGFSWRDMEAVLSLLLPTAPRWRTLQLLTDTWAPICAFLLHTRKIGPCLAKLEKLHLARCNEYFARKGQVFKPAALGRHLPLFGGAEAAVPRLREVALTGVHVEWSAGHWQPLSGLTKLELRYQAADVMPSVAQFCQILLQSPNLEVLAVVGGGPQFLAGNEGSVGSLDGSDAREGSIRLARLTTFTFGFVDAHSAVQLLELFDLPALRELSLEDVSASLRYQPPEDASVLLDWLADSSHVKAASPPPIEDTNNDNDNDSSFDSSTFSFSPTSSSSSPFLPLGQLHTLALHSIHTSRPSLTRLYVACAALSSLRLSHVCDEALALLEDPPESPTTPSQSVLLPVLGTLFVRGANKELFRRVVASPARETTLKDTRFDESPINGYRDAES
ncbi:F-box domain-containing protein [Favolaschia claudopus]|uniref:F-box domain-containing protein n=1 Tax=Favolaschia claudopus TaxID=2862362 RepID=A0AAW0CCW4_9AGAR